MRTRMTLTAIVLMAAVMALFVAGSVVAGPPAQSPDAASGITLAGTVASKISYQGRLTDAGGNPLNGSYNLVFQLWDDATAGSQVGSDIVRNNVPVSNGLFTVELDVPQNAFNGQALWLQVQVNGQSLSPRQELLPVPYALSLKPGAIISSPGPTVLNVLNESGGYGFQGWSQDNIGLLGNSGVPGLSPSGRHGVHGIGQGVGVYGDGGHTGVYGLGANDGVKGESPAGNGVHGLSTNGVGVLGETNAADQSGVRGQSTVGKGVEGHTSSGGPWVPAIYGKNVGAGDGIYGWSQNRHGTYGVTSSPDPNHAGVYGVNHGAGPAIRAEGDLFVTGAFRGNLPNGGAPFPRPAYDSGWQPIAKGQHLSLQHGLGGIPDNYVVDLQFRWGDRVNHWYYGEDTFQQDGLKYGGASWGDLTNQSIMVHRGVDDNIVEEVRVRIWVYR